MKSLLWPVRPGDVLLTGRRIVSLVVCVGAPYQNSASLTWWQKIHVIERNQCIIDWVLFESSMGVHTIARWSK